MLDLRATAFAGFAMGEFSMSLQQTAAATAIVVRSAFDSRGMTGLTVSPGGRGT